MWKVKGICITEATLGLIYTLVRKLGATLKWIARKFDRTLFFSYESENQPFGKKLGNSKIK